MTPLRWRGLILFLAVICVAAVLAFPTSFRMARWFEQAEDLPRAMARMREAIRKRPKDLDLQLHLVRLLLNTGELREAMERIEALAREPHAETRVHQALGDLRVDLMKPAEAVQSLLLATESSTSDLALLDRAVQEMRWQKGFKPAAEALASADARGVRLTDGLLRHWLACEMAQEDWGKAAVVCRKILQEKPEDPQVLGLLPDLLEREGLLEEELALRQDLAGRFPRGRFPVDLAERFVRLGRWEEARKAYLVHWDVDPAARSSAWHALELAEKLGARDLDDLQVRYLSAWPQDAQVRFAQAGRLKAGGRIREARLAYEAVLAALDPSAPSIPGLSLRAASLQALDRTAEAISTLENLLLLAPDDPDAHAVVAEHYLQTGDPARAASHVTALAGLLPNAGRTRRLQAILAFQERRFPEAIGMMESLMADAPEILEDSTLYPSALAQTERWPEALEWYEKRILSGSRNEALIQGVIEIAQSPGNGRPEAVLSSLSRILESARASPDVRHPALRLKARVLGLLQNPAESEGAWAVLLAEVPDDPEALVSLGSLSLDRGDLTAAGPYLDRLRRKSPPHSELHGLELRWAELCLRSGRLTEATETFDRLAPSGILTPDQRALHVEVLVRTGRWKEGVALHAASPGDPALDARLGRLLAEAGQLDEALPFLERARDSEKASRDTLLDLAGSYDQLLLDERALSARRRALTLPPEDPALIERLVDELIWKGRRRDGLALLDAAAERRALSTPSLVRLHAEALERSGRLEEAATAWERLSGFPDHAASAMGRQADVLRSLGRTEEEILLRGRLDGLDPMGPGTLSYAERLVELGRPEEALVVCEARWNHVPEDRHAALRTLDLAFTLDRPGFPDRADAYLERWPEDPDVLVLSGMYQTRHGNPKGRDVLEHALSLLEGPETPDRLRRARLLTFLDRRSESAPLWEGLLKELPETLEVVYETLQVRLARNDTDGAKELEARLRSLAPDHVLTKSSGAQIAFHERRYGDAARLLNELKAKEDPAHPFTDNLFLTQALELDWQWKAALKTIEEEARLRPSPVSWWRRQDLRERFEDRWDTRFFYDKMAGDRDALGLTSSYSTFLKERLEAQAGVDFRRYSERNNALYPDLDVDVTSGWVRANAWAAPWAMGWGRLSGTALSGDSRPSLQLGASAESPLLTGTVTGDLRRAADDPVELVGLEGREDEVRGELRAPWPRPFSLFAGARFWDVSVDDDDNVLAYRGRLGAGRQRWCGASWTYQDLIIGRRPFLSLTGRYLDGVFTPRIPDASRLAPLLDRQEEYSLTAYGHYRWKERWEVEGGGGPGQDLARHVDFWGGSFRTAYHRERWRIEFSYDTSSDSALEGGGESHRIALQFGRLF